MESGLKRLWGRRKSKSGAEKPASGQKNITNPFASSSSRSNESANREGKTSFSLSRRRNETSSQQVPALPQDFRSKTSQDDYNRPKSGNRIQPMLVGISRPDTSDRPGTAGSLQTAVTQAADNMKSRPSDVSTSTSIYPRSFVRAKSPGYIDILTVATTNQGNASRYNEDIAARNLDYMKFADGLDPLLYIPSSKYQEEVALRNASPLLNARSSMDTNRADNVSPRPGHGAISPQLNGASQHQHTTSSATTKSQFLSDPTPYHARQYSGRVQGAPQVPARSDERDTVKESMKTTPNAQKTTNSPPRNQPSLPNVMTSFDTKPQAPIMELPEYSPFRAALLAARSDAENTITDYRHANSDSRAGLVDSSLAPPSRQANSRPRTRDRQDQPHDYMIRNHSYGSSRRAGHRTIMDLTGDDVEMLSEASSLYGYSQYSPVVEQGHEDAFQKVQPSQIHSYNSSFSSGGLRLSMVRERSSGENSAADRNEHPQIVKENPIEDPFTITTKTPPPSTPPPAAITFSPINTVASWSPRSSTIISTSTEPTTMVQRVIAALEASKNTTRQSSRSPIRPIAEEVDFNAVDIAPEELTPKVSALNISKPAVETVTEPVRQPPAEIVKKVEPVEMPQVVVQPDLSSISSIPTTRSAESTKGFTRRTDVGPTQQNGKAAQEISAKPITSKVGLISSMPSIYASIYATPESLDLDDNAAPSPTVGIRTRDFAIVPQKSTSSLKKARSNGQVLGEVTNNKSVRISEKESKLDDKFVKTTAKAKTAKPRPRQNTSATRKAVVSGFDEEAFAKKQADAKAALLKLQQSLEQDFSIIPETTGKGKAVSDSENDGRPVAPTSGMISGRKTVGSGNTTPRVEVVASQTPPRSNSRNQQRMSAASGVSTSSSTRSASGSRSRRAPPSQLKHVEPATKPINQTLLPPSLVQSLRNSSKPPPSPGEISLSSFPIPSTRPASPPMEAAYPSGTSSSGPVRRNSIRSQTSNHSAYSIPYHMVPGRISSVRDQLTEEDETFV